MTSDVQEREGPTAETRDNWLGGTGPGLDVPGQVLASIKAGHPFTVVTGAQGIAADLTTATIDRLHADHIETTTIEAPLPNLAALTRAISTALSVVVDTERPLVVVIRQAEALRPDAMLRLPALAGLQRGGRPVLCFLLLGKPTVWPGLGTIGLAGLEHDEAAHIKLAPVALFDQPEAPPSRPPPIPRKPFVEVRDADQPSRGTAGGMRRNRALVPGGIAVVGLAVAAALFASQHGSTDRTRPPADLPQPATPVVPTAPPPTLPPTLPLALPPAPPPAALSPTPDLTPVAPAPPAGAAPDMPALPDLPRPAPEPAPIPEPPPAPPTTPSAPSASVPAPGNQPGNQIGSQHGNQPGTGAPAPAVPVAPVPPSPATSGSATDSNTTSAPAAVAAPPTAATPAPPPPVRPVPPGVAERLVLPDAGMLHIILQFPRDSDAAHARALRVAAALRASGATVDGPVPTDTTAEQSTIGYFFNADRSAADRLAHRLPAHFVHIRSPFGAGNGPMMRPGELIVTIGTANPLSE